MSPNLTEAKEPSIEMPELIADREVIVKKPGKEFFYILGRPKTIVSSDQTKIENSKNIFETFSMSSSGP